MHDVLKGKAKFNDAHWAKQQSIGESCCLFIATYSVPTCMGGLLDVSLEDLFKARLAIEAAQDNLLSEVNRSTNQDGNISDVTN